MKTIRLTNLAPALPSVEIVELRARLAEAEEALSAIRNGEVDTVLVAGKQGTQVFTLEGAERVYRMLIESMNEGALILTADKTILYANQCFARMVKCPLEQVIGGSLRRFLSTEDRATLRPLLKQPTQSGAKIQMMLLPSEGTPIPVQISLCPLRRNEFTQATINVVVTDMTEVRRNEEMLRALTHRVVQVQEAERGRVALELHDNITQLLCAVLFRSQALADGISARDPASKQEAIKLRQMLGETAQEVERISRNLRPGVLEQLGLIAVLRATSTEFTNRTTVSVELACTPLTVPLSADTELALYRILQEALKNIEQHAHAHHVVVSLTTQNDRLQLTIKDDGVGFDPENRLAKEKRNSGLGLLGMRERATYVGAALKIKSGLRTGTEIEVRLPLPPKSPRRPLLASAVSL